MALFRRQVWQIHYVHHHFIKSINFISYAMKLMDIFEESRSFALFSNGFILKLSQKVWIKTKCLIIHNMHGCQRKIPTKCHVSTSTARKSHYWQQSSINITSDWLANRFPPKTRPKHSFVLAAVNWTNRISTGLLEIEQKWSPINGKDKY